MRTVRKSVSFVVWDTNPMGFTCTENATVSNQLLKRYIIVHNTHMRESVFLFPYYQCHFALDK